jgi:hypothetical protein
MKIVVLSTDTEQYLLQWWLPHSAKKFDFGVIVDFGWGDKDDNTYELYKKFVPHWRYYKVTQTEVSNFLWDVVLIKIEKDLMQEFPGSWIMTLNPTELLVGNLNFLDKQGTNKQILIPCHLMNDLPENENMEPDPNIPILQQRHHGIHFRNDFPHPHQGKSISVFNEQKPDKVILNTRWMRSIHNYPVDYLATSVYSVGRHYWDMSKTTNRLAICHLNLSPFNDTFIKRKMNIRRRLTQSDHAAGRGIHHQAHGEKENLLAIKRFYDQLTVDLKKDINELEKLK